ncbi:MAG: cytochrome c biogenesis CcdA family protein [Thermodesulfobacteriota bacterium]|nr:cytochrome c biogenesis CcdA family protein [Thermodesulfobacteriota bacterium]
MPGGIGADVVISFIAGLLSAVTPCVVPLLAGYSAVVTGPLFEGTHQAGGGDNPGWTGLTHFTAFGLGFLVIFMALALPVTNPGRWALFFQDDIRKLGGAVTVLLGLCLSGVLFPGISQGKNRFSPWKSIGMAGFFIAGSGFAAGWTPCLGKVLISILIFAGTTGNLYQGSFLLASYTLGFALPLFLGGLALNIVLILSKRGMKYFYRTAWIPGLALALTGALLFLDRLSLITPSLPQGLFF